jgi:uncharacterized short protein YbdD (DUF466 family)
VIGPPIVSREAPSGSPCPELPGGPRPTPWARIRNFSQALRQMFGIPDYERYLAHMRERHPEAPVLSEREFHAMALERKYGSGPTRCC